MTLKNLFTLTAAAGLTLGASGGSPSLAVPVSETFIELDLHLEVDAGTQRAEVVLQLKTDEGLSHLGVFDAYGRQLMGLQSVHIGELGMSEVKVESSGLTVEEVMQAYPEGLYRIRGMTVSGRSIVGPADLSHSFPGPFAVSYPPDGGTVDRDEALISWSASAGAERYLLEIEQEDSGFELEVAVLNGETSFAIPGVLLEPARLYEYSLTAQGDNDNELEIEGCFFVGRSSGKPFGLSNR